MQGLFNQGKTMPMREAVEAARDNPDVRLVDVRTPDEYRQGHLPGSISVPLDQWEQIQEEVPDKNTPLYVYCLSGARSQAACRGFGRLGYTEVVNIGGISGYDGPLER
jgi:rhodanese-related sulfurtransferase